MQIAELMTREVEFIAPDAPVAAAAELMGELEVGALPVGSADRLAGIVTDRDLLYRVVARGLDCAAVRVADVASSPVVTCAEGDAVGVALDLMAAHHVRRLPVLDGGGRVSGWITLADLARAMLLDSEALQEALAAITESPPAAPAGT